ncbi:hypothetical protein B0H14DRAFT_3428771 [Mycena olivaceomarginata]|nr:hypothetical protein B0H14DRAFT_3428771 [Mycena olivaceomarginata]
MPFGRAAELEKYVLVYIECAAFLYAISFEVSRRSEQPMMLDPSVYGCLSQAVTFNYFLGRPTYGYVPGARDSFLSRISMEANLANKARGPLLVLDVPLTPDFASLPQGLHHTTNIATEEETPHETVGLIHNAVSMLLKNMVALGKASLKYGAMEGAESPRYFAPSEGTTLFGMAEHFVDLYGYHGDGSPFDRALMFDNLNTLFRAMVDLERYGIYEFIKPRQIAHVHAEDPRIIWHQFEDRLLRYNPKLGEAARYTFPDPSQEYAATCPNTPVPSLLAEIADGMEEDGEELDKENKSP